MMRHESLREAVDRMMPSVTFDPAMQRAVLARLHRRRPARRLTRRAAAAAILAIALALSASAIGLSVLDRIRTHAGPFAPALQSPDTTAVERDGIAVSVMGAYSDSYGATVYIAVQDTAGQNRLSADSRLDFWELDAEGDTPLCRGGSFDLNNLVSYDAETQTAIFCLQGDGMKMSGAQPGAQHTYTLTLGAIVPEAHELTFTLPQNALSQPISRTETIDHPIDLHLSADTPAEVPRAVLSQSVAEGVTVTAAGRLGDDSHVRLQLDPGWTAGRLTGPMYGSAVRLAPKASYGNVIFDQGHAVDGILHGVDLSDIPTGADLSFRLTYYTEPVLYGDWTIPVTFTVSEQIPLQIPAGCKLTDAALTAFHVLLTVPADQAYAYGGTTVRVYSRSGQVISCTGGVRSLAEPSADGQAQYFMAWSADAPVDLSQVAWVTVGDFTLTP